MQRNRPRRDLFVSKRLITNAAGIAEQSNSYTPFGDPDTQVLHLSAIPEEHSFIGERYDASTGLLFLNARYYDPDLGRFLQPDWWEVRMQGVGTNRYAYSLNDPVNLSDRNGHLVCGGSLSEEQCATIQADNERALRQAETRRNWYQKLLDLLNASDNPSALVSEWAGKNTYPQRRSQFGRTIGNITIGNLESALVEAQKIIDTMNSDGTIVEYNANNLDPEGNPFGKNSLAWVWAGDGNIIHINPSYFGRNNRTRARAIFHEGGHLGRDVRDLTATEIGAPMNYFANSNEDTTSGNAYGYQGTEWIVNNADAFTWMNNDNVVCAFVQGC